MSSTPKTDEPVEGTAGGSHGRVGNSSPRRGPPSQTITQRTRGAGATRKLATHYRLRCIALEATVDSLETQLRHTQDQLDEVVTRYEELLEGRNGQESRESSGRGGVVFTATGP